MPCPLWAVNVTATGTTVLHHSEDSPIGLVHTYSAAGACKIHLVHKFVLFYTYTNNIFLKNQDKDDSLNINHSINI